MANGNILEGLLEKIKGTEGATLLQARSEFDQTPLLGQLLSKIEGEEAESILRKRLKVDAEQSIDSGNVEPLLNAIVKGTFAQPQQTQTTQAPAGPASPTKEVIEGGQPEQEPDVLSQALAGSGINIIPPTSVFTQSAITTDEAGNLTVQQGGLFDIRGEDVTRAITNASNLQKLLGKQPLQAGEIAKLQIEYDLKLRNKLLTTEDEQGAGLDVVFDDVVNLVEARDAVLLKGRVGGVFGAAAAIAPGGFQRGERASFESFATTLAFSFGEHIIGQKGRAFTDNERKEIAKKITTASLSKTQKEFDAKMNAIIKLANSRLPAGAQQFPQVDAIKKALRQRDAQGTQPVREVSVGNIRSITPIGE